MNRLLFFLFFIILYSENTFSAENKIEDTFTIPNTEKGIDQLRRIHAEIRNSNSPLQLIEILEEEANKQSNTFYLTNAYKEKIYFYAKQSETDSIKVYLNKISKNLDLLDLDEHLSIDERRDVEAIKLFAITTKSYIYMNENKYDIVLIEVNKMLESSKANRTPRLEAEAYTLLGSAYLYSKDLPEAIKCFRKAYNIDVKLTAKLPPNNYNFYRPMEGLSIAYGGSEKYKEALQISDSLLFKIDETYKYLKESNSENADIDFIYQFHKHRASCYDALWNTKTNNTKKARIQLDSVKYFIQQNYKGATTPSDFDIYDYVEANYWYAVKNYSKAKEYALSMTDRSSIEKSTFTYMLAHLQLAKIINAEGNCSEAYTLMEKLYWQNDSISAMNFSDQVAEMQTLYQVDKAEIAALQSERELSKLKRSLSIAFFAIILCITIAILIWQNRRKIVKKNIQLYNQYIEIKNQSKEIAILQQGLIRQQGINNPEPDENSILIQKLEEYLQETKCFLNPDLTREELAIQMGTNRQYLIEAIKDKRGKTFNEFIYSFRLEYAHEQIINNKKKSISEILIEAGFLTRTTFYKAFKDVYGLTPNELRHILN